MGGLPLPWRWLVWVAGAALLVTGLWWAPHGDGDPPPNGASSRKVTEPQPNAPASSAGGVVTLPAPVAERPQVDDEVQVCGLGWVKAQADGSVDPKVMEQASRATDARAGIVAALRADKSELSQAAGLWMSMIDAGADIAQIRDALAKAVVSSTDPQAYALAFNVCRGSPRNEGACQMLSASQWARLDPGNATPWLTLLSEAKARKDRAAEEEALYRIGSSQRSDLGFFAAPAQAVNAASGDDLSVLAAWSVAVEMTGYASAWSTPSYQHAVAACKGAALTDMNRRQTCDAIADVLTDHSTSFVDQMMGVAIGKQLGRPAVRREWQSDEYAAYVASTGHQSLACADLRHGLDDLRRKASVGEVGAVREWVAQSGKRPEDFAREARLRQTQQALDHVRSLAASAPDDAASGPRASSAAAPP